MPGVGKQLRCFAALVVDQTNEVLEWSHCVKLYPSVGKVGLDEGCNLFK